MNTMNERRGEIWFTSDTHFMHANIIRFCNRPFADVNEMNEALIANWNERIGPGDTVYHLGDFCLGSPQDAEKIFNRLNGNKHLILGNHDKRGTIRKIPFAWVKDVYKLKLGPRQYIWLSHYAHRRWPHSHHGSYHLYGHSHGELPSYGRSMDVGVDAWDYYPVHLDKVLRRLEKAASTEHHDRRS
jgi:calcineurin-like phosphoesterase family protein